MECRREPATGTSPLNLVSITAHQPGALPMIAWFYACLPHLSPRWDAPDSRARWACLSSRYSRRRISMMSILVARRAGTLLVARARARAPAAIAAKTPGS